MLQLKESNRQENKSLVYSVFSRRAGGLSVGIDLFPDKKQCSFDCPYCEVFPFSSETVFSLRRMEEELRQAIDAGRNAQVMDICFSGNGEPTLSPHFAEALAAAGRLRAELVPSAKLVLITNGSGFLDGNIFALLKEAAFSPGLDIWLKLDSGTPDWYGKINRSSIPFQNIIDKAKEFASCAPFTIQTMLCAIDGCSPPPEEDAAWEKMILQFGEIAASSAAEGRGGGIRKVQIYGKARSAPEDPKAEALPVDCLESRAESLRAALREKALFAGKNPDIKIVEVYP